MFQVFFGDERTVWVQYWERLGLGQMGIRLASEEILELSLITDLSVNKYELVTDHEQFKSETAFEISQLKDMLNGNNNEERTLFYDKVFEKVTKLNDEEIELLDKVFYNKETHEQNCPVCLNEHTDGELLVSLKCPCKRERLCQNCAFKAMKEKPQCPCCREHLFSC